MSVYHQHHAFIPAVLIEVFTWIFKLIIVYPFHTILFSKLLLELIFYKADMVMFLPCLKILLDTFSF